MILLPVVEGVEVPNVVYEVFKNKIGIFSALVTDSVMLNCVSVFIYTVKDFLMLLYFGYVWNSDRR